MDTDYCWQKAYLAALLETYCANMRERLQVAAAEIRERQRVLSEDHGGTEEERNAILDAISGLRVLGREASEGKNPEASER